MGEGDVSKFMRAIFLSESTGMDEGFKYSFGQQLFCGGGGVAGLCLFDVTLMYVTYAKVSASRQN